MNQTSFKMCHRQRQAFPGKMLGVDCFFLPVILLASNPIPGAQLVPPMLATDVVLRSSSVLGARDALDVSLTMECVYTATGRGSGTGSMLSLEEYRFRLIFSRDLSDSIQMIESLQQQNDELLSALQEICSRPNFQPNENPVIVQLLARVCSDMSKIGRVAYELFSIRTLPMITCSRHGVLQVVRTRAL